MADAHLYAPLAHDKEQERSADRWWRPRGRWQLWALAAVSLAAAALLAVQRSHPAAAAAGADARVLFVFRDAGEVFGLLPLFRRLGDRALAVVLPGGTAPPLREPRVYHLRGHRLIDSSSGDAGIGGIAPRDAGIDGAALAAVLRAAPAATHLVAGLVSAPQLQCARAAASSMRVVGFDDGIGVGEWSNSSSAPRAAAWGASAALARGLLDELWVTAHVIRERASASASMSAGSRVRRGESRPPTDVALTGSPALRDAWPEAVAAAGGAGGLRSLRRRILGDGADDTLMLHLFGGAHPGPRGARAEPSGAIRSARSARVTRARRTTSTRILSRAP